MYPSHPSNTFMMHDTTSFLENHHQDETTCDTPFPASSFDSLDPFHYDPAAFQNYLMGDDHRQTSGSTAHGFDVAEYGLLDPSINNAEVHALYSTSREALDPSPPPLPSAPVMHQSIAEVYRQPQEEEETHREDVAAEEFDRESQEADHEVQDVFAAAAAVQHFPQPNPYHSASTNVAIEQDSHLYDIPTATRLYPSEFAPPVAPWFHPPAMDPYRMFPFPRQQQTQSQRPSVFPPNPFQSPLFYPPPISFWNGGFRPPFPYVPSPQPNLGILEPLLPPETPPPPPDFIAKIAHRRGLTEEQANILRLRAYARSAEGRRIDKTAPVQLPQPVMKHQSFIIERPDIDRRLGVNSDSLPQQAPVKLRVMPCAPTPRATPPEPTVLHPDDERRQMVLPEATVVYDKPPYSYAAMIVQALCDSETGRMSLSEIYSWIIEKYPYFLTAAPAWQNSIRHNLSLNKAFKRVRRNNSKGSFWTVDASALEKWEKKGVIENGTADRMRILTYDCTRENAEQQYQAAMNSHRKFLANYCLKRPVSDTIMENIGLEQGLSEPLLKRTRMHTMSTGNESHANHFPDNERSTTRTSDISIRNTPIPTPNGENSHMTTSDSHHFERYFAFNPSTSSSPQDLGHSENQSRSSL